VVDSGAGIAVTIGGTAAGAGNIIAFNTGNGVNPKPGLFGDLTADAILGNSIHDRTALGIDLGNNGVTANDSCNVDTGSNNPQDFPVLGAVTICAGFVHIVGSLKSAAGTTFRLEFFSNAASDASGNRERATFPGSTNVTPD
jgi:hypothetical protein